MSIYGIVFSASLTLLGVIMIALAIFFRADAKGKHYKAGLAAVVTAAAVFSAIMLSASPVTTQSIDTTVVATVKSAYTPPTTSIVQLVDVSTGNYYRLDCNGKWVWRGNRDICNTLRPGDRVTLTYDAKWVAQTHWRFYSVAHRAPKKGTNPGLRTRGEDHKAEPCEALSPSPPPTSKPR